MAKDVSALANRRDGVLVFGVRTEKDENEQRDIAVEVTPFVPETSLRDRVTQVIERFVYPPVECSIKPWSGPNDSIVTIRVTRIGETIWPVIVRGAATDDENMNGNYIGVWIRDDDRVVGTMRKA